MFFANFYINCVCEYPTTTVCPLGFFVSNKQLGMPFHNVFFLDHFNIGHPLIISPTKALYINLTWKLKMLLSFPPYILISVCHSVTNFIKYAYTLYLFIFCAFASHLCRLNVFFSSIFQLYIFLHVLKMDVASVPSECTNALSKCNKSQNFFAIFWANVIFQWQKNSRAPVVVFEFCIKYWMLYKIRSQFKIDNFMTICFSCKCVYKPYTEDDYV